MWTHKEFNYVVVAADIKDNRVHAKNSNMKEHLTTYSRAILQIISFHIYSKLPQRV